MKKVLVTGENGYIGKKLKEWILKNGESIELEYISVKDSSWENKDFSKFNSIIHLASIVHRKRIDKNLYYLINRDLTIKIAKKAKKDGVKHFLFMSTMSVYSQNEVKIGNNTETLPDNHYGKSKLEAEQSILKLSDSKFLISIIRPPMVYGEGSKGNYNFLSNFSKRTKFCPLFNNTRSMIYIDNLSCFLYQLIKNEKNGIYHPQNDGYVNVKEMIEEIALLHNNNIYFSKLLNKSLRFLKFKILKKVTGDLYYEKNMSNYDFLYNTCSFKQSIARTERISSR